MSEDQTKSPVDVLGGAPEQATSPPPAPAPAPAQQEATAQAEPEEHPLCLGTTASGKPCKSTKLLPGTKHCYSHQPEVPELPEETGQRRGGAIKQGPEPEISDQSKPWGPVSVMHVANKDPKKAYRFSKVDRLEKRIGEGWQTVKAKGGGASTPKRTLMDGTVLNNLVMVRGQVLLWMTKELAAERAAYYARLTDDGVKASTQELQKATDLPEYEGSGAYGTGIRIQDGSKR